jgi:hypothetical protein
MSVASGVAVLLGSPDSALGDANLFVRVAHLPHYRSIGNSQLGRLARGERQHVDLGAARLHLRLHDL